MNLSKPNRSTVDVEDKGARLLSQLMEFYDALIDLGRPLLPSRSPNLKSITLETLADLRKTVGDDQGEKGPRCILLAGGTTNVDALAGAWAWDATSVLADDGLLTVQVAGVVTGRWRKIPAGLTDGDKGDIIVSGGGTVLTIDTAYSRARLEDVKAIASLHP